MMDKKVVFGYIAANNYWTGVLMPVFYPQTSLVIQHASLGSLLKLPVEK